MRTWGGTLDKSGSLMSTAARTSDTVLPSYRRWPVEHFVENHAEGPDVGTLIDRLTAGLLGRHVGGGAEDDAGLRHAHADAWANSR